MPKNKKPPIGIRALKKIPINKIGEEKQRIVDSEITISGASIDLSDSAIADIKRKGQTRKERLHSGVDSLTMYIYEEYDERSDSLWSYPLVHGVVSFSDMSENSLIKKAARRIIKIHETLERMDSLYADSENEYDEIDEISHEEVLSFRIPSTEKELEEFADEDFDWTNLEISLSAIEDFTMPDDHVEDPIPNDIFGGKLEDDSDLSQDNAVSNEEDKSNNGQKYEIINEGVELACLDFRESLSADRVKYQKDFMDFSILAKKMAAETRAREQSEKEMIEIRKRDERERREKQDYLIMLNNISINAKQHLDNNGLTPDYSKSFRYGIQNPDKGLVNASSEHAAIFSSQINADDFYYTEDETSAYLYSKSKLNENNIRLK